MASDDLMAGLAGGLEGARDVVGKYTDYLLRKQTTRDEAQARLDYMKQSSEIEEKRQTRLESSRQAFELQKQKELAGYAQRPRRLPVGKNVAELLNIEPGEYDETEIETLRALRVAQIGAESREKLAEKKAATGKTLTGERLKALTTMQNSIRGLGEIINEVESKYVETGPATGAGAAEIAAKIPVVSTIGDIGFRVFGSEKQQQLKSKLRTLQGSFLSEFTGAQRGFKEIEFALPALPSPEQPKRKFIATGKGALATARKNLRTALSTAKKAGYNVSEFETEGEPVSAPTGREEADGVEDVLSRYGVE